MEDTNTQNKTTRSLKVYGIRDDRGKEIPQLRFQGKWLGECGFAPGSRIEVECREGELIIRRAENSTVLIAGSRTIQTFDLSPYVPENCGLILNGGAKGIDTVAEQYAAAHGIKTKVFEPDYERFGKAAPLKRNEQMVESADLVLAIWDGKSRGTKHTIDYARKAGKTVKVITVTVE